MSIQTFDTQKLTVVSTTLDDPRVQPLLADLAREYATRYNKILSQDELTREMTHYPAAEFAAPDGALVLILAGTTTIAGGALRTRTEPEVGDINLGLYPNLSRTPTGSPAVRTAELKRIWTSPEHRRQGLGKRVLVELETRAQVLGFSRLYLTTGPRQPEAEELYLRSGYRPLYSLAPTYSSALPFEKWLSVPAQNRLVAS